MKTALQQLIEKWELEQGLDFSGNNIYDLFIKDAKELLELEKQQIINAVDGFPLQARDLNGEDYYEEVYRNK